MSASVQRCLRRLGSYECLCPRAIITAWGRILRICTNAVFLKDLYVAKLQSWARDNITTTTWPCFQAKQLFINTVCRYGQGFLEVDYLNGRYVYCILYSILQRYFMIRKVQHQADKNLAKPQKCHFIFCSALKEKWQFQWAKHWRDTWHFLLLWLNIF